MIIKPKKLFRCKALIKLLWSSLLCVVTKALTKAKGACCCCLLRMMCTFVGGRVRCFKHSATSVCSVMVFGSPVSHASYHKNAVYRCACLSQVWYCGYFLYNFVQVTQLQPKTKCLHPQLQPKTKCLHQRVPTLKSAYILLKSLGQKGLAALQPHLLLCAFANSHIETATHQSAAQLELLFHFPRCHGALSFHSS